MNSLQKEALRVVIREMLTEELESLRREEGASPGISFQQKASAGIREENVTVTSTETLTAFARRICDLARDEQIRENIESGRWIFHPRVAQEGGGGGTGASKEVRFEKGLVSERQITPLAQGACIRAGKRVCFTPLALDEIRRRRITIEREK